MAYVSEVLGTGSGPQQCSKNVSFPLLLILWLACSAWFPSSEHSWTRMVPMTPSEAADEERGNARLLPALCPGQGADRRPRLFGFPHLPGNGAGH